MSLQDSVACLMKGLRDGDGEQARRLWERYFERLAELAGSRLPRATRRVLDGEDIALSALRTFCDRAGRGQFPRLADRDALWKLLATITTRKLIDTIRRQGRLKRGGGRVVGDSDQGDAEAITQILARDPTPEAAAQLADAWERLLDGLGDPTMKAIAVRRLEGYSSEEIAAELRTTTRTVDRKLALIRAIWKQEVSS